MGMIRVLWVRDAIIDSTKPFFEIGGRRLIGSTVGDLGRGMEVPPIFRFFTEISGPNYGASVQSISSHPCGDQGCSLPPPGHLASLISYSCRVFLMNRRNARLV